MRLAYSLIICLLSLCCNNGAYAEVLDGLQHIATRTNVTVPLFTMEHEHAIATILILPGGAGGFGKIVDGKPDGRNFLVRSRDYFFEAGFNVAIMGKPSDINDLDYRDRISAAHMEDIDKTIAYLKEANKLPVWLVGTSRGTVSATAAAIALGEEKIAGIVLSSSIVNGRKIGAVPLQKLDQIRIPVLVIHNEQDSCTACPPAGVPRILEGLINTPVKKLIWMTGSQNPVGDPCEALHYHGFIDIEKQTVQAITNWIKHPVP